MAKHRADVPVDSDVVTKGDYINTTFGVEPGYVLTEEDHLVMEGKGLMETKYKQVGWIIQGGEYDGLLVSMAPGLLELHLEKPHGGFAPVYVEVGD